MTSVRIGVHDECTWKRPDPWVIYRHLVPHGAPKDSAFEIVSIENGLGLEAHLVPQVKETGKNLITLFGAPSRRQICVEKVFLGPGPFHPPSHVTGELWTYGPINLMLQNGDVKYIWVEGKQDKVETPGQGK
jgi:hypothetical protein